MIDRILAFFGVGRTTPLQVEIEALKEVIQDLQAEKLTAEALLRAAQDDKTQLWDMVRGSLDEERKAYQMHLNLQWQRQGLEAPYPDAPKIPASKQTAYQPPKDPIIQRPLLGSELVAKHKREIMDKMFGGDEILQ